MPQEPWPRITVVTPNLNGAAFLEQTILSVSGQDYPNLEYIVVDGGSTDASLDILQRHSHRISHLIQGPDRNLYDAVARGFDAATGDILAWLNSDDLYEPGALHRAAEAFRSHPERQVIYFNSSILKDGWRLQNRPQHPVGCQELMRGHILYQESVFFTRTAYQSVGGLDRTHFRLAGDYDLWLRLAARHPLHFIPATAACFRIRPGQLSGNPAQYQREMEIARLLAVQREVQHAPVQTTPAATPPSSPFTYPLHDEHLPWPVLDTPEVTVSARCPQCRQPPPRLLFTTGAGRIWYLCSACHLAFAINPPARLIRPESFRPFATTSQLSPRPLYKLLGHFRHTSPVEPPLLGGLPQNLPEAGFAAPNLDSIWAERYGPAWRYWHHPEVSVVYSRNALELLAGRTGQRLHSLRTLTPTASLVHSDLQAPHGACPNVSPVDIIAARHLHAPARGAARLWDTRGRGDLLVARFNK
ncbi:MAG: glycosyltransferase [Bryobacteraceae bacterium]|nr:glycosyltransferase [Bryobacteraceae bacterium]